jgi:hypothetical protein
MYSTISMEYGIMLDDDQAVTSLFEDGHELERGEATSDLQLGEPSMY